LFAFGYGLSYTSFEYSTVKTDKINYVENDTVKLSFTIKNTGKVKGAEVTQIYVSDLKSSVPRPLKELKAFSKVTLEAGETKHMELNLPIKNWAFYNDKIQMWEVEAGTFSIMLGTSSDDIKHKININVSNE